MSNYTLKSLITKTIEKNGQIFDLPISRESSFLYKKAYSLASELEKNAGVLDRLTSLFAQKQPGILERLLAYLKGTPHPSVASAQLSEELAAVRAREAMHEAVGRSFAEASSSSSSDSFLAALLAEKSKSKAFGLSGPELALLGAGTLIPTTALLLGRKPEIQITQLGEPRELLNR